MLNLAKTIKNGNLIPGCKIKTQTVIVQINNNYPTRKKNKHYFLSVIKKKR